MRTTSLAALALAVLALPAGAALYRCDTPAGVTFQDAPCPAGAAERMTKSPKELAAEAAKAAADQRARDAAAKQAADKAASDKRLADYVADEKKRPDFYASVYAVKPGMTTDQLRKIDARLVDGGTVRRMDSIGAATEWRTFERPPVTIVTRNGVVEFIHGR